MEYYPQAISSYFVGSAVQIVLTGGAGLLLPICLTAFVMKFGSIICCLAGSRNDPRVVNFHLLLVLACLGGQFIIGCLHIYSRSSSNAEEMIKKEFTAKFDTQSPKVKNDIQTLQTTLECCGLNGYKVGLQSR